MKERYLEMCDYVMQQNQPAARVLHYQQLFYSVAGLINTMLYIIGNNLAQVELVR
jgi:hypothetical protein